MFLKVNDFFADQGKSLICRVFIEAKMIYAEFLMVYFQLIFLQFFNTIFLQKFSGIRCKSNLIYMQIYI